MLVAVADGGAQFGSAEHATRDRPQAPMPSNLLAIVAFALTSASEAGEVGLA
jgi:hypothetical protein